MAVKSPPSLAHNGSARLAQQEVKYSRATRARERASTGLSTRTLLQVGIALVQLWRSFNKSNPWREQKTSLLASLPRKITREGIVVEHHIREGRFQRSLSLITAFSALLSGLEVTYEHYIGSYSQRI